MDRHIALDCEMVGSGNVSILARVSLVNSSGSCVYDKFVKPTKPVTDYRTPVSGITRHHLVYGEKFTIVQKQVHHLIRGKILVGHSLHYDLAALMLSHPQQHIRDIATYRPFKQMNRGCTPSLRLLADCYLGQSIQNMEHDSVEDARVAMEIYLSVASFWP